MVRGPAVVCGHLRAAEDGAPAPLAGRAPAEPAPLICKRSIRQSARLRGVVRRVLCDRDPTADVRHPRCWAPVVFSVVEQRLDAVRAMLEGKGVTGVVRQVERQVERRRSHSIFAAVAGNPTS